MARNTASFENRDDVSMVLNVHDLRRLEPHTRFVICIPLLLRFVTKLAHDQRRIPSQIPRSICRFRGLRELEISRLLTVRMTTTAVISDFTRPQLVPGLSHVQNRYSLVQRLKGKGCIRGDHCQESRIGIAIGIEWLAVAVEF